MHQVGLSAAFKSKIDLKSKFDCLPILLIPMQGPQSKERAAEMLKFSSATLRGFTMGADVSPNTLPPLQPPNSRQRAIVWIGIVWKGTNFINLQEILNIIINSMEIHLFVLEQMFLKHKYFQTEIGNYIYWFNVLNSKEAY